MISRYVYYVVGETDTLAQFRQNSEVILLGLTVSLNPSTKVESKYLPERIKGVNKVNYGILTPEGQQRFLMDYLKNFYFKYFEKMTMTFEFNKRGLIHVHCICMIKDKDTHTDYWLNTIRGNIRCQSGIYKYIKNIKHVITSNYIHKLEDSNEWIKYMFKENDNNMKSYMVSSIPMCDTIVKEGHLDAEGHQILNVERLARAI